ncbi:MAG: aldo/keto reductase [Pelagibacteraceae bacterium]|jgi:aryl-alcohol dehydrogenase-like predicted oxidoreductase
MKFKKIANTDLNVSQICLGTMTWGQQNSQEDGFAQMDYALEKGINFFDTAELYATPPMDHSYGKTEVIIGNWFNQKKNRDKIILASKIAGPGWKWIRGGGNEYHEKGIEAALHDSLKRLQTDYIDLYQLHWPERNTNFFGKLDYDHNPDEKNWHDLESVLRILEKYVKQGKIRHIGISNETPWGFSKFLEIAKISNLPKIVSVQNPYSLLNRTYEIGMAEISCRENVGLLAYSPLAFGYLTGKYRNNQMPKKSRMDLYADIWGRYRKENGYKAVDEYFKIAEKYKMSLTHLSLAFVNTRPFVTSNIIGATTIEQLKENIESIDIELSKEIINDINKVHQNNPNPAP